MRFRHECGWCILKEKNVVYKAETCECGYDLTNRCSACWEQHAEECVTETDRTEPESSTK